jgi:amino acid adenylation domain-containing protein
MPEMAEIPLSFGQRRLWFLQEFDRQSVAYNIPVALRLTGELDQGALAAALGDVTGRHESLRTVFPVRDGEPLQRVLSAADAVPELELVRAGGDGLAGAVDLACGHVFDLASEVPVRAWLAQAGPDDHVLVLVVHHIAADGWSMGPLLRDLGTAYGARRAGRAPAWAPLPVQYSDFTLWQREVLGDPADPDSVLGRQAGYWRKALAGLPERIELPADFRRPVTSPPGGTVPLRISPALHQALARVAAEAGATVFMVVAAGLAALLSRMGAGTDIPLGMPVAGRTDQALEELVGFFVNTLVLRADVTGNPTFAHLVGRVRQASIGAYASQDLPFEMLVEILNPPRVSTHHPLFQVSLDVDVATPARPRLAGLKVRTLRVAPRTAKFDLALSLAERRQPGGVPAGLEGSLAFRADLFTRTTAASLARRLTRLLAAAADSPHSPVSSLDVALRAERRAVAAWKETPPPVVQVTIPELFEAQAARTPRAVAAVCPDARLTYAELDQAACRLARFLASAGIGPEAVVGVVLPRTSQLIVALIAVLKTGAACLPVDPGYPRARTGLMLADAGCATVLTAGSCQECLPADMPQLVLDDPGVAAGIAEQHPGRLRDTDRTAPLTPAHPAYVIYTSGTTGTPKGVVVTHGSVASLFHAHTRDLYRSAERAGRGRLRAALVASVSFDTFWEPVLLMLAGHQLHLIGDQDRRDPEAVAAYAATHQIDFLNVTPSLFAELYAAWPPLQSWPLLVVLGGEQLARQDWDALASIAGTRGYNFYGPTECTIDAVTAQVTAGQQPVIGRPLHGVRAYVLDERLRPVPPLVAGELYLAGRCLARGYLRQPGLTAERFVADPLGPAGSRMYRTGDVTRRTADGQLEFLGRADDQVKIRGLRIEPAETQAVLASHPDVAGAAVIVRDDLPGGRGLAGYVVPAGSHVDTARLREHAAALLPGYLVPATLTVIDRLPLTPQGKLDGRALPAPSAPAGTAAGRGPRTPAEAAMCALFAEVLGARQVGPEDSFFDMGGHSLLAIRLISRVRSAFGASVSVRSLFSSPTPAGLVERLRDGPGPDPLAPLLPLRAEGTGRPLFCIHPGGGLSWCYAALPGRLGPGMPVYGLQARGLHDGERLPGSIAEMAADYLQQVRAVQPVGPYYLAGWCFGGGVAHQMAAQAQEAGDEVAMLALVDAAPSNPSGGRRIATPQELPVSERQLLRDVLNGLDVDLPGLDGQPLDRRSTLEIIRQQSAAAVGLADHSVLALMNVLRNNIWLSVDAVPGTFRGDILFFAADTNGVDPARWAPYVTGQILTYHVPARHDHMTHATAIAKIAPVMLAALRGSA